MKLVGVLLSIAALTAAASVNVSLSDFSPGTTGIPEGWTTWAPRPEIAPVTFVDPVQGHLKPGSLAISGNSNPAAYGGWVYTVRGIEPGKWYRFTAYYRTWGRLYETLQVVASLNWTDAEGKRAGQPNFAWHTVSEGLWKKVTLEAPAPERAAGVKLQLYLKNAAQATVWWDDISLVEIPTPASRLVSIATVNCRPSNTRTPANSVKVFLDTIEKTVPPKTDIILLPEGITIIGTGKKYAEVAEPIPGPTTTALSAAAKRRRCYIVAGIYELEGKTVYNTAVLIDRNGNVAGKYRKVYIPREEMESGITPGDDYPVFETDFGKIGMMICWDAQFADPARALALRGAEIVFVPIWGGNQTLGKARAIENQIFVVTSGYDYPTYIMDPQGEILVKATENGTAAVGTIDLSRPYVEKWLGNMRERFMKELRVDLPVER